ncbi:MAG: Hsp20/alpha crystallin family protein [bacterium]|nr:Hsp20/alpha crystallin family protein [bacterium]
MLMYNIFDEALQLRNLVDDFFRETSPRREGEFPYVDLYEGNDEVEVRAVVPGVEAGDLDLQLENNYLVISGEKKSDRNESAYRKKERLFGKFNKRIKLPYRVDAEKINAELKNGILTVKLVKSEDARPKKIEIH